MKYIFSGFLTLMVASIYFISITCISKGQLPNDFYTLYHICQNYLQGMNLYQSIPLTQGSAQYATSDLNTPIFHLLLIPFTLLQPSAAFISWSVMSLVFWVSCVRIVLIELNVIVSKHTYYFIQCALLLIFPVFFNVITGQVALILLPLLIYSWVLLKHNQLYKAAIVLGTLFALKLFFGLFVLYFLFQNKIKEASLMILVFCILTLAGVIIFGLTHSISFYHTLHTITWYSANWNGSLLGFLTRLFGAYPSYYQSIWHLPMLGKILYFTSSTILIAYCYTQRKQPLNYIFNLYVTTMLIISPLSWLYYFCFLLIPIIIALKKKLNQRLSHKHSIMIFGFITFPAFMNFQLTPSQLNHYSLLFWFSSGLYALTCMFFGLKAVQYNATQLTDRSVTYTLLIISLIITLVADSSFCAHVFMIQWGSGNF